MKKKTPSKTTVRNRLDKMWGLLVRERAENEWEYLRDRFTAVRKIASLEQEMMKSQLSGF